MKTEEEIKKRLEVIREKIQTEKNPLNYIFGSAQIRVIKWVLEILE